MGQEITQSHFHRQDFDRFGAQLSRETAQLHAWVEAGALSARDPMAGLELEAWLIDDQGRPAPRNDELLAAVGSAEVVSELGRFNFELNVPPQSAAGDGLQRLADDLHALWGRCTAAARSLGLQAVAIGILPSLRDDDLTLASLSARTRYRALNEQVLRQRHGRPVTLDIEGADGQHLRSRHQDVMLEAAATSFQVHLQMPAAQMLRVFNASALASGVLVAGCANSPLLFGRQLWQETRIPLFEQALGVWTRADGSHADLSRVGFGSGYCGFALTEPFVENLERFEPLLPYALDGSDGTLPHLRLHNGTIWRWNRPILGFDAAGGPPHIRLEHRPLPAGPSLPDMVANLAWALGLITDLALQPYPPEARVPFEQARAHFHAAARSGLQAVLGDWDGAAGAHGRPAQVHAADAALASLVRARRGLEALRVAPAFADRQLALVGQRLRSARTGAAWQLAQWRACAGDARALTLRYAQAQASGLPVHDWSWA
jgi:hypothetical protein